MRVGLFCLDYKPEDGGASTLTKTIIEEIKEYANSNRRDEFVVLYSGNHVRHRNIDEDGNIQICNINCWRNRLYHNIRKIDRILGLNHLEKEYDRIARKLKLDIIWFCNPVLVDISIPYIYTVWDLGHRTVPFFPEVSANKEWELREKMYTTMIPRASWIVTGNEEGKKEITECYSALSERILIAPFPVASFCRGNERKPSFDIPEAFFFYPAQFWPHKNHIVILEALKILKEKEKILVSVYLSGSEKGNKEYIIEMAKELGIEDQVLFTGFLSDEEMKYMYTHATAMIYSSLLGPNNMPPIEAAFLNCPVVISNIPGHVEQLGDAGMYFDGDSADDLARCMQMMMSPNTREEFRRKLSEKGKSFGNMNYTTPIIAEIKKYKKYRKCWR